MDNLYPIPCSREELEYRLAEYARRARARQLFYCYAPALAAVEGDDEDGADVYSAYYADEHGH